MLTNLRGYKSKETSLRKIIRKLKPSCIAMNETLLRGNMKVSIPTYTSWSKNRTDKGGGGIATSVAENYKDFAVEAGQGEGEEEYLITRFDCFSPPLNIINCYGSQRREKKEDIENKWKGLRKDMEGIRARNELCCLIGDLNKLVGIGQFGVPGNHPEVSLGGRLLKDLLETGNWTLVNGMKQDIVQGGPFTRKDPASGKGSCLDLFIVSRELLPYVKSMKIDSKREITVARAVRMGDIYSNVYSDHYSCILTLENLPRIQERRGENKVMWNLAKEGGWNRYSILTDECSEAFEKAIDQEDTIEGKWKKFNKVLDKVKFKAFGKVTSGTSKKKGGIEEDEVSIEEREKALFEEGVKRCDKEIEEIKKIKTSKAGKIWEIRKRIIGGKKATLEATAIMNPDTNKLVVSKHEIKRVTLNYCKKTLENNEPEKGFEDAMNKKREYLRKKMSESDGVFNAKKETFGELINKFKRSGKPNYHLLVRASKSFQDTVYRFSQMMIQKEEFPQCFQETTLHMIFKGGKGRKHILSDNRFVHSKFWFPRTVEGLVVIEGLKKPLVEGSSVYQIGGQPGHRSEEHVFVLKSVIARYRTQGKQIILQTSDISKFFDKEMVEDAIQICYKRGADAKACRIWYKLNNKTKIRVRTGAGMSPFCDVGAIVGQGTMGGALVSQGVLDEGISEQFSAGGRTK